MNQTTAATLFQTREDELTENNFSDKCGTFSTLIIVA
jgi:hypothetical protein